MEARKLKIKKKVQGQDIDLEIVKIKDYPRYSLYQVYKLVNGKRIPMYTECYTELQIQEIIKNKNLIAEEVFE